MNRALGPLIHEIVCANVVRMNPLATERARRVARRFISWAFLIRIVERAIKDIPI
jgi:hypothetical protein